MDKNLKRIKGEKMDKNGLLIITLGVLILLISLRFVYGKGWNDGIKTLSLCVAKYECGTKPSIDEIGIDCWKFCLENGIRPEQVRKRGDRDV